MKPMDTRVADISAKIAALNPVMGENWDSGPYSEQQLTDIEARLGRTLDSDHEAMLRTVGGSFGFALGPVLVGDSDRDVSIFLGVGEDDHNIVDEWEGYRGQIPKAWYPFARDSDGDLYCVDESGSIHHIHLDEAQWAAAQRPQTAGEVVCESWLSFVMSLRLPDWARE